MKKFSKVIIAAIVLSASYPASAGIITPISISKLADMDFGTITGSHAQEIKPVAAAKFTVTGLPFFTYSVTLQDDAILTDDDDNKINIAPFLITSTTDDILDAQGQQVLSISAMLNLSPKQPAGHYTNLKGMEVTVNYN